MNREKLKKWIMFFCNPRLILCYGLAWMVTNGWSYVMLGVGSLFEIPWMLAVSGAYLTFVWLPISPEKIVTVAITMALLRALFPADTRTLGILRELRDKLRGKRKRASERLARRRKHTRRKIG
ncbi:MAG: hypothetical protein IJV98_03085 [Clostridia bacterium]|nr:hypothetical protein [Clostridia bacterium]